jgi:hypothetical protein
LAPILTSLGSLKLKGEGSEAVFPTQRASLIIDILAPRPFSPFRGLAEIFDFEAARLDGNR